MARDLRTVTAVGAVLLGLLGGCSTDTSDGRGKAPASAGVKKSVKTGVKKGGTLGAKGSACALPAAFDIAAGWTAEAVDTGGEFGALRHGPVALVCEIDAKPAGHIGYLRVWTGGSAVSDPREALEAFAAAEAPSREDVTFTMARAGSYDAVEVTYLNTGEFIDEPKEERALAFTAEAGLVVLHLGGLDTAEHRAMLPAYELAKRSVRAGS